MWSEKYPRLDELHRYFQHVESKLDLKKDIMFNTRVVSADFQSTRKLLGCQHQGRRQGAHRSVFHPLYRICSRSRISWHSKALKSFRVWPATRRTATSKANAWALSGMVPVSLQVMQEVASDVAHMTVFQRSPTYALPMRQARLTAEQQNKSGYPELHSRRRTSFAGIYAR